MKVLCYQYQRLGPANSLVLSAGSAFVMPTSTRVNMHQRQLGLNTEFQITPERGTPSVRHTVCYWNIDEIPQTAKIRF
jgi:hypothetical protein